MRFKQLAMSGLFVSLVAFLALEVGGEAQSKKLKVLIVTGFDVRSHAWHETTELMRDDLESTGRFEVRVAEDVGIFESSTLKDYDVVVLNYGFWAAPDPSEEGKKGLLDYVKGGKGLVAVHFACSSFQEWGEYRTLLGRVWKKDVGGHGPRGTFTVNIKKPDHPITKGLSDFETYDELYAKLTGEEDIEVLASAYSEWSKKVEPIVFVKKYGEGRVVHNVLGHGVEGRKNEHFRKLLIRGVEWAARGEVTIE